MKKRAFYRKNVQVIVNFIISRGQSMDGTAERTAQMLFWWVFLSYGVQTKEYSGTLGFLQYRELENRTLNFNAYKCKKCSGEKNSEK